MTSISFEEVQYFLTEPELTDEGIEKLNSLIHSLNESHQTGDSAVSDAVYDRLKSILQDNNSSASSLKVLWDEVEIPSDLPQASFDGYDRHLMLHPMQSIKTVKDVSNQDFQNFASFCSTLCSNHGFVDLHFSEKIDGHGIRLVYVNGAFHHASSRARGTQGRDLTPFVKHIIPSNIPAQGIVEVRGELCLTLDSYEIALETNPTLKTPFSAVSSLIRPSSSVSDNQLLSFRAYTLFHSEDIPAVTTRTEEYLLLQSYGFETPHYSTESITEFVETFDDTYASELETLFNDFVDSSPNDLYLDGVIVEIDNKDLHASLTSEDIYRNSSLALKIGRYAQGTYSGVIDHIEWTPGRVKLSPVAVLNPPVLTAHGNSVSNIPLYEPVNIYTLSAYPGNVLHFRYGGEAGVVPCYPDGSLLTDSVVDSVLSS